MAELSKRSLRERRAPKSFDSDNEDQDPWGYSKPSYSKQPRNPSQQLNSDAKLLVKFISAINKSFREKQEEHRKKQIETIKEPLPIRDRNIKTIPSQVEIQKRCNENNKEMKLEPTKKQKQSYNFKAQTNNTDIREQTTPESFLNKCKALNTESAQKMLNIQYGISKNKPNGHDQPRAKTERLQMMGIQGNQLNNSFKKTQVQASTKQQQKSSSQNRFYNFSKQKQKRIEQVQASLNIPKPTISQSKLFKRSAYHVAIAYHIYVIQQRSKGVVGIQTDPTAKARKLKQGMNR